MNNKYSIVSYVKDEAQFYLRAMLESIVPFADEIIIVDNGSSDNTVAMIREYPQIKLLEVETSPEDISIAINKAIDLVTNDWILIQAGDEVWLPEQINKIPDMIDEMIQLDKRIGMIQYLDFIKDFRHYHTKYTCWASRIWKNECGFKFHGDWMGEIYMGYDDGVHTGGIRTKKNLPEDQLHKRDDIKFFHYARCKPQDILKKKRRLYWQKRVPEDQVKRNLYNDPFYTLDFGDQIAYYDGPIPKHLQKKS